MVGEQVQSSNRHERLLKATEEPDTLIEDRDVERVEVEEPEAGEHLVPEQHHKSGGADGNRHGNAVDPEVAPLDVSRRRCGTPALRDGRVGDATARLGNPSRTN